MRTSTPSDSGCVAHSPRWRIASRPSRLEMATSARLAACWLTHPVSLSTALGSIPAPARSCCTARSPFSVRTRMRYVFRTEARSSSLPPCRTVPPVAGGTLGPRIVPERTPRPGPPQRSRRGKIAEDGCTFGTSALRRRYRRNEHTRRWVFAGLAQKRRADSVLDQLPELRPIGDPPEKPDGDAEAALVAPPAAVGAPFFVRPERLLEPHRR